MALLLKRALLMRVATLASLCFGLFAASPAVAQITCVTGDPTCSVRTSSWTYIYDGLVESETIEPDDPDLALTTSYSYDDSGNKIATWTKGSPNASPAAQFVPRGSKIKLDALRRFTIEAQNSVGDNEIRTFYQDTGAPKTVVGPNGLQTSWEYDDFGRKVKELRADGSSTTIEYLFCTGVAGGTATCPERANYLVRTKNWTTTGVDYAGPVSTIFFDMLDREVERWSVEMSKATGSWEPARTLAVRAAYDAQGRALQKSEPFDPALIDQATHEIVWTTFIYDQLGRVVNEYQDVTNVNAPATSGKQRVAYSYTGLSTKSMITRDLEPDLPQARMAVVAPGPITDKTVQIRTTVKNAFGQTESVTEGSGTLQANGTVTGEEAHTVVTYGYDPYGNQTTTTVQGHDAADVTTTVQYDKRGRKTSMNDPDKGHWAYDYNALGELIRQTDAKQQIVEMTYDLLGRTTKKVSKLASGAIEKTDVWTFGTVAPDIGKPKTSTSYAGDESGAEVSFKSVTYDTLGRPVNTSQRIHGVQTSQSATYETETGRLATVVLPSQQSISYTYDDTGVLASVWKGSTTAFGPFWTAGARNERGQLLSATSGNGVVTNRTFSQTRGFVLAIKTTKGTTDIQDLRYEWDNLGIMTKRHVDTSTPAGGYTEEFVYDELQRLTGSTVTNGVTPQTNTQTVTLSYDGHGNILGKSDVGAYLYGGTAGPHAVTQVQTSLGTELYNYDANGNLTLSAGGGITGRSVGWTSFNMPTYIERGTNRTSFTYDEAGARAHQINEGAAGLNWAKSYFSDAFGGNRSERKFDQATQQVSWTDQIVVGGEMIATVESREDTPNNRAIRYMHSDHLGSVQAVTDENGVKLESLDYDPWGQRRYGGMAAPAKQGDVLTVGALSFLQDRGFTGHEMLDDVGLIHMNGRIYDARLARFLSADPFVQDQGNSQSYNRYSYVNNNPLAATDPTGYFLSGIIKFFKKLFKNKIFRMVVGIAVSILLMPTGAGAFTMMGLVQSFAAGFAGGFISSGGNFKAALIGGVTAAAFYGIGQGIASEIKGNFDSVSKQMADIGLPLDGPNYVPPPSGAPEFGSAMHAVKIVSHAAVGCASSVAGGGSCQSGALSAGFSAGVTPLTDPIKGIGGLAVSAAVGGTASVLGGGKFANGAWTAAYGYIFNALGPHSRDFSHSAAPGHEYSVGPTRLCNVADGCSIALATDITDPETVPFVTDSKPGTTQTIGPLNDPVFHTVDRENGVMINATGSEHIFAPGSVVHNLTISGGSIYLTTVGTGTGFCGLCNIVVGKLVFIYKHDRIVDRFRQRGFQ